MEKITLKAQKRDKSQKAKVIRRQKMIPAEYYGHGIENESLQLDYSTFLKAFRQAGENTIINLEIEGNGSKNVLVHNVDYHPVTDEFAHVELINVRMDEEVNTNIPVRLEGTAPAVKDLGGTLVQVLDELEVKCLPKDLVHEFILNVDSLVDFNAALYVKDIKVPAAITIVNDLEQMVASVSAPREEEVIEAAPAEVDLNAIEVTTEKKAEEGEGEAKPEGKKEE